MAQAKITLPGGAHVDVTGTPEEVAGILQQVSAAPVRFDRGSKGNRPRRARATVAARSRKARDGSGTHALILGLKQDGFFTGQRRLLGSILEELESKGHILPRTTVAPALLRLVKARELRRLKENGHWVYTTS
jgi:hypothetical protein